MFPIAFDLNAQILVEMLFKPLSISRGEPALILTRLLGSRRAPLSMTILGHVLLKILLPLILAVPLCAQSNPIRVVALTTVLTEIAQEVGGDQVEVKGLIQPGTDPHTFDPSAAQVRTLVDAEVIFSSGLHLQPYVEKLTARAGLRGDLVEVGNALPLILSVEQESEGDSMERNRELLASGEEDPHWWHNIDNVIFAADLIRKEYSRIQPSSTALFADRAQAYEQRLFILKTWVAQQVRRLKPKERHLVTSHDAFGYFAREYDFTIHSINGLAPSSEANIRHVARLVSLIRREKIPALFVESSASPQLMDNLIKETGVRVGGTLYADGLGPTESDAATYDAMYRHNIRTIVDALSSHP